MKPLAFVCAALLSPIAYAATSVSPQASTPAQLYIQRAEQQQLAQQNTWQRLMYANASRQSTVSYSGYFLTDTKIPDLNQELQAHIVALFQQAEPNQSVQCRFPARSRWLVQQLNIPQTELATVACPELDEWIGQIRPHKTTLIYATDFMGNPSSMFGHTLLRLDPKDQQELNLISYAVNYAATVPGEQSWSYAWKGLTGQYPGEYSLMPYYRKVKEYGDLESRDLWEYELDLSPDETRFLVEHIWEMKHVSFPYYFVSDNCAYRLLGLIDLVRPELNLQQQFKMASIPVETIKALADSDLVKDTVYRPALETQLLAQARQHGTDLAQAAHQLAFAESADLTTLLQPYTALEQAKILEMAYDDLYLQFLARKVETDFAQPRLRQLLSLRSQLQIDKQRHAPEVPKVDPSQGHHARNLSIKTGEVQGQSFIELGHRQAYHDLFDSQGGFRTGTQLLFLQGAVQYRDETLKLSQLDLLAVNSYNPSTPFKTPLSWGFNLGWGQEAVDQHGQFSAREQHGVAGLQVQMGYSWASADREHICYAQLQNHLQAGKALERGWRVGIGPTLGCQNIWSPQLNSVLQLELPYWEDAQQWNVRLQGQLQYVLNPQHTLRLGWEYQQQDQQDWHQTSIGYAWFF